MIGWSQSPAHAFLFVTLLVAGARCEPLEQILERIDRNAMQVTDLTCTFEEEKHTALLKTPIVSQGKLFVKQGRTRWHTTAPHESMLFTDLSGVAIYFPSRATMEIYPVEHRLADLIVSPLQRMQTLRRHFNIKVVEDEIPKSNTGAVLLRLTPREASLAEFIELAHVIVDTGTGLASRFEMLDSEGDRTVITFTHVRVNTGLSDSDVARTAPPSTKIVRPFGLEPKRDSAEKKQP